MKKCSKLLLSQTAVALPVAFSATTYQINETLTVDRSNLSLGDEAVDANSAIFFDTQTGAYEVRSDFETGFGDLAISLSRVTTVDYANTALKAKGNAGNQTKALKAKSSTPIGPPTLGPLGTNGFPIAPNFKSDTGKVDGITTSYMNQVDDYMGVKSGYVAFAGVGTTQVEEGPTQAELEWLNFAHTPGTNIQYLGFLAGEEVEVFAKLTFTYVGTDYFADSVMINEIIVGDPGEDLITYEDFVAGVPESKQTAALVGLLAGSAALYSRRRKKA